MPKFNPSLPLANPSLPLLAEPQDVKVYPELDPRLTYCVGDYVDIYIGDNTTTDTLPAGLSITDKVLSGTLTSTFCATITFNSGTTNSQEVVIVVVDGGTYTPTLVSDITRATFAEQEGNYVEACDIVNFTARFKRRFRSVYTGLNFHSNYPLIWADNQRYDFQRSAVGTNIQFSLIETSAPNDTTGQTVRDTSTTKSWNASTGAEGAEASSAGLGPLDSSNDQYLYWANVVDSSAAPVTIKRANITDATIATDTTFSITVSYYDTDNFVTASDRIVPIHLFATDDRLYLMGAVLSTSLSATNLAQWWRYNNVWEEKVENFIQSYSLAGVLQTSECVNSLRHGQAVEDLFDSQQISFMQDFFKTQYVKYESGSGLRAYASPEWGGAYPSADGTKLYVLSRAYSDTGTHTRNTGALGPVILGEYAISNHIVATTPTKELVIDGIRRTVSGLYRDGTTGDFYFLAVSDRSEGLSLVGGAETEGLYRIPNEVWVNAGTDVHSHSVEVITMDPPVGAIINNGIGTVSNTRGGLSSLSEHYVQDENNKLKIHVPFDFSYDNEIFVTGQYNKVS